MEKYDGNGVFLNKFGKRIAGVSNELHIDARVKHCALQDDCFCSRDADCATGQYCGKLSGFKVCKDTLALLPRLVNTAGDAALTILAKQLLV